LSCYIQIEALLALLKEMMNWFNLQWFDPKKLPGIALVVAGGLQLPS